MRRSVFLSHSSKDKDSVRELYHRLTKDGVDCFYDAESIGWGDNWVRVLERALDECSDIVFVLSPDFCNSEWVEVERTSSIANDPAGLKRKARPLMLRACSHLSTFPRFLRTVQTIDVSTQTLFEANYPRICQELGGVVVQDIQKLNRAELPPVQPLPALHRMPYLSLRDNFVGRTSVLWEIYDLLHRDSTTIVQGVGMVAGTGGLGKSQTAIEYVHRFGAGYHGGVYWVDADRGLSTLISQVSEAAKITIDNKADEPEQVLQLWRGLNNMPPSLVVLDNFPEKIPLRPYLPTAGRVHTLITTRRQDITSVPRIRLNILSTEAGIELLNSGVRRLNSVEAASLVERLGGLPLALELTESFLNFRPEITVPDVLSEIESSGEMDVLRGFIESYGDELPSGHDLDIARTFQRSWELASEPAKTVLRVMAELAPLPVPRRLLRLILGLPKTTGLKDELGNSISELVKLSLTDLDSDHNPVMHRLIRAFVRYRNEVDDSSPFEETVKVMLLEMDLAFQNPGGTALSEMDLVVPHAEALVATDRIKLTDSVNLLNCLGQHHQNVGRYLIAEGFFSRALEKAEGAYDFGHSNIAAIRSNLAVVNQDLGRLDTAQDLLEKALASNLTTLRPGDPSIALTQSNLAMVLLDLGHPEEARDLLEKALASNVNKFYPGHPYIATAQSNLAMVLLDLGHLEEARDLLEKALASDERTFDPGHPSIATRQSNLASVLKDLGQLEEARHLIEKALASNVKTFDPGHPSIARSQSNLALALQDLGQLEKARDLLEKALASDEKTFDPGHPSIAIRQSTLATDDDPMVHHKIGGVNVFGGGLAMYDEAHVLVGAVGVSGDTSCADHNIDWRVRNLLKYDHLAASSKLPAVGGVSGDAARPDNIIFDITENPNGGTGKSAGGFGHPTCLNTAGSSTLPPVRK